MCLSVPQTAVARTLTSASPFFGFGIGTSRTCVNSRPAPRPVLTTAFIVVGMGSSLARFVIANEPPFPLRVAGNRFRVNVFVDDGAGSIHRELIEEKSELVL